MAYSLLNFLIDKAWNLSKGVPMTGGRKKWTEPWLRFLGLVPNGRQRSLNIVERWYAEEKQHVRRFTYHAQQMQYPQFRNKLLEIAADEQKHADWLGDKITLLRGKFPEVQEISLGGANSWQILLADLEEEKHCAAELLEQIRLTQAEFPDVGEVLQRIYDDEIKHRNEIQEMLLRSDPLALELV